jgi:hypothetical protein
LRFTARCRADYLDDNSPPLCSPFDPSSEGEKKSKKNEFFLDIAFPNFYIGKKWEKVDKSGQ